MNHTLLIGNGVNRAAAREAGVSWNHLLDALAAQVGMPHLNLDSKPLPLAFEELLSFAIRNGVSDEDALKEEVARWTSQIAHSSLHGAIMACPVAHVLTTNYDYALEAEVRASKRTAEARNSLFRFCQTDGTFVWHIHGEAEVPRSLLLGHDHYVRYANRIQNYLSVSPKAAPESPTRVWKTSEAQSPLTRGDMEFDLTADGPVHFSWVDLFLRDHVHVLGFGCDFSEVIMWWLLTFKARKAAPEQYSVPRRRWTPGRTTLHLIETPADLEKCRAKREVLEALGVEVREYVVQNRDYRSRYLAAIEWISRRAARRT